MPPRRSRSAKPGRRPEKRRRRSWLGQIFIGLVLVIAMGVLGLACGVGLVLSRIPSVDSLLAARPLGATQVLDREGHVIASLQNGENRELVPLSAISVNIQHAVIASEDIRFFEHHGVDPRGLLRALISGGQAGGGSTLTQQLAKNLFLSAERTPSRKLADMYLAIQLERRLPKDKILEMYLNEVYFGHGAYGVEAASRKYFGKRARDVSVPEAAMLAGLLPAPEYYSPYRNPKPAKERQLIVLSRMVAAGYIDEAAAKREGERHLVYANTPDYAYRAPYFTSQVLALLSDRLGADLVMRGALKIYTTLDLHMQENAEVLIRRGVARYHREHVGEGALVAIEPGTGAVRALVGGTNYDASPFNRAVQAHRQPGSTFKPFVYLTAFMKGYAPGSIVNDAPVAWGRYAPQNYDRRFRGPMTFERAVALSENVPAVKVASLVGIENVIKTAAACGIKSPLQPNLSLALGSAEVTPLELASAYATLGNNGTYIEPHFVTRVEDHNGNQIDAFTATGVSTVPEAAVWALNRCLEAVTTYGTGAAANFGRPCAGKTGTTSDNRDTWFAGYTPQLACVIWMGNDDDSRLAASATGGVLVAPLWARFMREAHAGLPVKELRTSDTGVGQAAPVHEATGQASAGPTGTQGASGAIQPGASVSPGGEPTDVPASAALEGTPLDEQLPVDTDTPTPDDGMAHTTPHHIPVVQHPLPTVRPVATPRPVAVPSVAEPHPPTDPDAQPSMDVIQ